MDFRTVSEHLKNVYASGELDENPTRRKIWRVQTEGKRQAEMRANRQLPTTMQDWIGFMSGYLDLNGFPVLQGLGKISKAQADEKAIEEYEKFRPIQDAKYVSDFEKLLQIGKASSLENRKKS